MYQDKQKMIKRILKEPPMFGSPYTKYNYDKNLWEWNENTLQDMSAKEIERLMNAVQRV